MPPARSFEQRTRDTLAKLEAGGDAWVASASGDDAHLVPLSLIWHEGRIVASVPTRSATARNLAATGRGRVGFGPTRDVVMVDVDVVEVTATDDALGDLADAFAARTGWDPRTDDGYSFVVLRPTRVQAWREANEIAGRTLMRDGDWLTP